MPYTTKSLSPSAICAVIDVGSNTLRLLIGRIEKGELVRIYCGRAVTRLSKNLLSTGYLNPDSVRLSITSIEHFKVICEKYGVNKIIAFGTSALRDAKDGSDFVNLIKNKAGISVDIISGEIEAELTLKGIIAGNKDIPDSGCDIIVDIGGGSTEVVIRNKEIHRLSFPVGAVKLFEKYIRNDPPSNSEIRDIWNFLGNEFKSLHVFSNRSCSLIATGGTPTTIGSIQLGMSDYDGNKVHGLRLAFPSIDSLLHRLLALPLNQRLSITGLEKERADIIIPGIMIIMALLRIFNSPDLIVSDYGLMEGALYEACEAM